MGKAQGDLTKLPKTSFYLAIRYAVRAIRPEPRQSEEEGFFGGNCDWARAPDGFHALRLRLMFRKR
jgi:hypothetical protein